MPIRLRLTLWYAGLTSLVLLVALYAAYAVHNGDAYDEVDRDLVAAGEHIRTMLLAGDALVDLAEATEYGAEPFGPALHVRAYDAQGRPLSLPSGAPAPPLDLQETVEGSSGRAADALVRWLPGGGVEAEGVFATGPEGDARARLYALPVEVAGVRAGYVQAWKSLAVVDHHMRAFREIMFGFGAGGVAVVTLASWLIAGRALRPVSVMTRTARAIASSGSFSRRVPEPARRDELGQLAGTFNEMLASLEEAYRHQQRFIADASHELRAPLTAIQGNIELLARIQDMPEEERAEALSYLERESTRLSRMVGELLTLARADAGQGLTKRPVELDLLLTEALQEMRSATANQKLVVEILEPVVLQGDPDRLKQLVRILLDNAVKYTPPGGRIRLCLQPAPGEAIIHLADSGIGIPPEALPHVFERFYRADRARGRDPGGTGLGLSIARWIVEQHGGRIEIDSVPDQGTRVTVRLPLTPVAVSPPPSRLSRV